MIDAFGCEATGLRRDTGTVLIVEDEAVSRRALSMLLNSHGYATTSCESAEEALERVADGAIPEIAVVDIDLPGMSGLELATRLEQMSPGVQTVLVSAVEGDRVGDFCAAHTNVAYFRKPIIFRQLLNLIDTLETEQ
jgi:two-component system cell cycle sensor histidine kinase/response regulator CckA